MSERERHERGKAGGPAAERSRAGGARSSHAPPDERPEQAPPEPEGSADEPSPEDPRGRPPELLAGAAARAEEGAEPGGAAAELDPSERAPTAEDMYLFNEGTHHRLWWTLGAHPSRRPGERATRFAVWAPNARSVAVIGDFNGWSERDHPLEPLGGSGLWGGRIAGVGHGDRYKFHVVSGATRHEVDKRDPFAFHGELPPRTASIVWDLAYEWSDGKWMGERASRELHSAPMSIYELHPGSWRRLGRGEGHASYRELAGPLVEHVKARGFTHVEFLPLCEHPFYGSWGYQTTSYFAPSARYGTPQDLKHLIDVLHQNGIGVILDWVPSHFPTDEHGLAYFDGTHLFEHADPRRGYHPDWHSFIFNYGRHEVRSFLISNALYWLLEYHVDALRVDAVASMLYLDYSRAEGQWVANVHGGRENLEAIDLLRRLNAEVGRSASGAFTVAEESTAWPRVTGPAEEGGLGFTLKWDMGWMHDTLEYFQLDPIHRRHHHDKLTFRQLYAYSERFVLPLSHDEVVHGKGSLLGKMPGDRWQKFANLRLLHAWMHAQPGKKLLFMGGEIGQEREWDHDSELQWELLSAPEHEGLQRLVSDLNRLHAERPELHELDFEGAGFEWVDVHDREQSTIALLRRGRAGTPLLAVLNFTPVPRHNHRVGVPVEGFWAELVNTDDAHYGGSGQGNLGGVESAPIAHHGRPHSLVLVLPPLAAVFLAPRT